MKKRVVVTGLGVVSSLGIGKDDFWENLVQGKSGISEVDAFDTCEYPRHYGGQVRGFKPGDFIDMGKIEKMGRASQMAIASARCAFDETGLNLQWLNKQRIAVVMGTTAGESQKIEEANDVWVKQGKDFINSQTILQSPVNNVSSNVAREFKITGPTKIFTNACAAGNYAIGYGFDLLQQGKANLVVAGGSDAFSYIAFTGFSLIRAVAPEKCQPFDKNRKGMIVAEGAATLILESLDSALRRGACIYAEILGYGLSCDAYHMIAPHYEGMTNCMKNALESTNTNSDEVSYICAHGTGTFHNDRAEAKAIKEIFGEKPPPVSSIKSMLGHAMGAASAIEAVACCLSVKTNIIVPTINYETPDPECDIDCVPNKARKHTVSIALNNSFAFGGNNSCLVFKKFTP